MKFTSKCKFAVVALILSLTITGFTGCTSPPTAGSTTPTVVTPQTAAQVVYTLETSLTIATNALADLHTAGVVTGDNYNTAIAIQKRAVATLMDARAAVTAKDSNKAAVLLTTLNSLIDQIAIYNGGKK